MPNDPAVRVGNDSARLGTLSVRFVCEARVPRGLERSGPAPSGSSRSRSASRSWRRSRKPLKLAQSAAWLSARLEVRNRLRRCDSERPNRLLEL